MKKLIVFALTAALCLVVFSPCAFADSIDFIRQCYISITNKYNGQPVSGGSYSIYFVGIIQVDNGGSYYDFSDEYLECTVSLENISSPQTAKEIADYTSANNISGTTAAVDANGWVGFGPLDVGLYLVVQDQAAEGFYPIEPFLVSVPANENGSYNYRVDASPKLQLIPMPDDPDGPDDPDKPGGGGGGGSSDDSDDSGGDYIPEVKPNDTEKNEDKEKLPDTGLNSLPVPILAVCGCCLVVIGWYLNTTGKKR